MPRSATPVTPTTTVTLSSALHDGVQVRPIGPLAWSVNEPQQDDLRLARLIRIVNEGPPATVTVQVACANPAWMSHLYLVQGGAVTITAGNPGTGCVTFTLEVPHGMSCAGPEVWYTNDAGDRFFARTLDQSPQCRADTIGTTREGRPIRRLMIGNPTAQHVVVVAGREHADEPSGSFAVEAVADALLELGSDAPLLKRYRFDLIPIVNPDGVAHGEAYPQPGRSTTAQPNPSDPHYCGMTSDDPTVAAWRTYLFAQRPAAIVNYHAYWALPFPQVIFYDKQDGMAMLDLLIDTDMTQAPRWYAMRQAAEHRTMLYHCVQTFGTVVGLFELPWRGRSVEDVRTLGIQMFRSVMVALARRRGDATLDGLFAKGVADA